MQFAVRAVAQIGHDGDVPAVGRGQRHRTEIDGALVQAKFDATGARAGRVRWLVVGDDLARAQARPRRDLRFGSNGRRRFVLRREQIAVSQVGEVNRRGEVRVDGERMRGDERGGRVAVD